MIGVDTIGLIGASTADYCYDGNGDDDEGDDDDTTAAARQAQHVRDMQKRSKHNVRFNHVRIGEIRIRVSYRGGNAFNFEVVNGAQLKLHALT